MSTDPKALAKFAQSIAGADVPLWVEDIPAEAWLHIRKLGQAYIAALEFRTPAGVEELTTWLETNTCAYLGLADKEPRRYYRDLVKDLLKAFPGILGESAQVADLAPAGALSVPASHGEE